MPVYDYRCEKCDHTVEVIKKISQSSEQETCPDCENYMNKMISGGQMHIKVGYDWADK
jgi:putative FmdB family regulatory protein